MYHCVFHLLLLYLTMIFVSFFVVSAPCDLKVALQSPVCMWSFKLSEKKRIEYTKKHCDCEAQLVVKFLQNDTPSTASYSTKEEKARIGKGEGCDVNKRAQYIPKECKQSFKTHGSGVYITSLCDIHCGCYPINLSNLLSAEQEVFVRSFLYKLHLKGSSLPSALKLLSAEHEIVLAYKQGYVGFSIDIHIALSVI